MKRVLVNLLIATALVLPMLTYQGAPLPFSFPLIDEIEDAAYNWRQQLAVEYSAEPSDEIAIINIDADAISQYGTLPWHNDVIADLVTNLRDVHETKMILLLYPLRNDGSREPDRIFKDLISSFSNFDTLIIDSIRQMQSTYDPDARLRRGLDGRFVLFPYELDFSDRKVSALPDPVSLGGGDRRQQRSIRSSIPRLTGFTGYSVGKAAYSNYALATGFVADIVEKDATTRRFQFLARYAGQPYPSVALQALRFLDSQLVMDDLQIKTVGGLLGPDAIDKIRIGKYQIPVSSDGSMLVDFSKVGSVDAFDRYSALEILSDETAPKPGLRDKIVLVGASASDANDLVLTPLGHRMPRVQFYAAAMANVLEGDGLQVPNNAWLFESAALIIFGLFLSLILPKLSPILSLLMTIAIVAAIYYLNFEIAWKGNGEVYRLAPFIILLVLMFFLSILSGFLIEWYSKRHVQNVLGQYLPPSLAKQLGESKKGFSMEGEIREMSILFSDVRGFTSISEKFTAQDLTKFMNQMLTVLSKVIHDNRGTIDKYIGDAVMAFWNAPLDDSRHSIHAVQAALGMQFAMEKLSESLVSRGLPELKMGIGVNSGETCVGNMGSAIRLAYTVMGDPVNLASRLEGITKQYEVPIIVGEKTYELSKDEIIYRPVDKVRVKGKQNAVTIYEPLGEYEYASGAAKEKQEISFKIWEAYSQRRFVELHTLLEEALTKFPSDGLFMTYRARAQRLIEAPPGDDWEPITNFDTK